MAEIFAEDTRNVPIVLKLEFTGYLRRDDYGRVYIDTCKTNEQHLLNRHGCRKYIEDLFPERMIGKHVQATIGVFLEESEEAKK